MAQIAPYLKPPGPVPPGDDEPAAERDALNLPRLGVAGFWRRVGGFAFDFVVIWFATRLIGGAMGDRLLANADAAWMAGGIGTLLYFALQFGPLTGGRTLGMRLVGVRVVTLEGGVPGHGAAFLRALVLLPGLVVSRALTPMLTANDDFFGGQLATLLTVWLTFALFTAQLLAIVFNPFKMGLHDYAARTMVRPAVDDLPSFERMQEIIGPLWRRYYMQPLVTGVATFLVVFGFALIANWPTQLDAGSRDRYDAERALLDEVGLGEARIDLMRPVTRYDLFPEEFPEPPSVEKRLAELTDEATTAPLLMFVGMRHHGKVGLDAVELEAAARTFVEGYHRRILAQHTARELFLVEGLSTKALRQRPIEYHVVLYEYVTMLVPVAGGELGKFTIAMPPAEVTETPTEP